MQSFRIANAAAVQTQKVLSTFYFLEKTKESPSWTVCHRCMVKKALSFPKTTCLPTFVINPLISLSESEEIVIMCHQSGNYCVQTKAPSWLRSISQAVVCVSVVKDAKLINAKTTLSLFCILSFNSHGIYHDVLSTFQI